MLKNIVGSHVNLWQVHMSVFDHHVSFLPPPEANTSLKFMWFPSAHQNPSVWSSLFFFFFVLIKKHQKLIILINIYFYWVPVKIVLVPSPMQNWSTVQFKHDCEAESETGLWLCWHRSETDSRIIEVSMRATVIVSCFTCINELLSSCLFFIHYM